MPVLVKKKKPLQLQLPLFLSFCCRVLSIATGSLITWLDSVWVNVVTAHHHLLPSKTLRSVISEGQRKNNQARKRFFFFPPPVLRLKNLFYSIRFYLWASPSLPVWTQLKWPCSRAHMLSGTRKPVETVHSGPRKHTERFGCNSHIGQLNAATSALSLPFAYGIHMLMMSPCFFFVFFPPACVYVHVCFACVLFVSLLCIYFFFACTSSPPPILFVLPNKKRCRKFGFILPLFPKKRKKKRTDTPVLFSLPLAWRLKGRLDECHSCSIAVPLISTRSPFNSREGKALSLPRAA